MNNNEEILLKRIENLRQTLESICKHPDSPDHLIFYIENVLFDDKISEKTGSIMDIFGLLLNISAD